MNLFSNSTVLLCFGGVRLLGYHTSASLLPGATPEIPTANSPTAIALTNELKKYVFVSAGKNILKINLAINQLSRFKRRIVCRIEIGTNTNIYGRESFNKLVIVFYKNLKFLNRNKLETKKFRKQFLHTNSQHQTIYKQCMQCLVSLLFPSTSILLCARVCLAAGQKGKEPRN